MNRLIDLTLRLKWAAVYCYIRWCIWCRKMPHHRCAPQIVLGTILSVQMDLAGQHGVQVVGHIPSGSVELCR